MKSFIRSVLFLTMLLAASLAFAVPSMKVTVFDARGKVSFQGNTNASGTFTTGALQSGRYIVQFNSRGAAPVAGNEYGLVVSAGSKKVVADVVTGEKFLGGGVAMRIEVGPGSSIAGQIVEGALTKVDPKTGEKLVWVRQRLGSNLAGRWVRANSTEAIASQNTVAIRREDLAKWQDHGDVPHQ
jgi:hypothetical protein